MEYWTFPERVAERFRLMLDSGGPAFWCQFDYVVSHAVSLDELEVTHPPGPDVALQRWFPSIKRGIEVAVESFREEARLVVMARVEITRMYTHPRATTERGCEIHGMHFFHNVVKHRGRKVSPVDASCLVRNQGTVVAVARAIRDDRAFGRLPILADALEDAGCQDADILEHCRQPGLHSDRCWVVEMLIGGG